MIPCGFEAFSFDAAFETRLQLEQVQGDAVEQGEVLRGISGSFTAQVFSKGHIQHPVQLVFDAPMLANLAVDQCRVGSQAGDVVTGFVLGAFSALEALPLIRPRPRLQ